MHEGIRFLVHLTAVALAVYELIQVELRACRALQLKNGAKTIFCALSRVCTCGLVLVFPAWLEIQSGP